MLYFNTFVKNSKIAIFYNKFSVGDVAGLSFRNKGSNYFFEGLCIALKKNKMTSPESAIVLRNILSDVGVELTVSYFYNRNFFIKVNAFKRKRLSYGHSKLYYVRNKLNKQSRVF